MSEIIDSPYYPDKKELRIVFDRGHALVFEGVSPEMADNYRISFDKKSFIKRHLKRLYKFFIHNKQFYSDRGIVCKKTLKK